MRSIPLLMGGLLAFGTAHAAGLDATFGSGGKLLPGVGASGSSQASGAILQSDGKIVIVGSTPACATAFLQGIVAPVSFDPTRDFLIVRLNSDGSLDSTFGSQGSVRIDFNQDDDRAMAVAQQPDGKLVVVGGARTAASGPGGSIRGDFDLAIARLLPNGTLDTSFGSGGKVTVNIPGDPNATYPNTQVLSNMGFSPLFPPDIAYSVVVQSDGKLLIGGATDETAQALPPPFGPWPTLTRLTPDGEVDTAFGPTGTGTIVLREAFTGTAYSIAVEASGAILVPTATGPYEVDATGHTATRVGPMFSGYPTDFYDFALAIQPDGRLLYGGARNVDQPNGDFQLRLSVSRTQSPTIADTTFGTAGTAIGPDGFYEQYLTSLALDPGGNILAGGVISSGPDELSRQDALILRMRSDGTPDSNFADQGMIRTDFSDTTTQYSYRQAALLRQSDGKLLMVGNRGVLSVVSSYYPSLTQSSVQIALARFNSTPEFAIASNTINTSNTAGSVAVEVNRTGATTGSVSVSYVTSDGTATAGMDYTAASGTLTWLPSDSDSKTITIPITNNGLSTGSRTFSVMLTGQTDGSLSSPNTVVTIQDNAPPATTATPPPTTGGGGGGSIDGWVLSALGAAALRRRWAHTRG
jgi:uncharacterized delta-60 repeat protein